MTYNFGDGFDLYATITDPLNGYWDSGTLTSGQLVAGRFPGSQAFGPGGNNFLVKASGANDAVHHFAMSVQYTAANANPELYFELFDGTSAQCTIQLMNDGSVRLLTGGTAGTVVATYTPSAPPAVNAWVGFEFEVVVNNTTGSFAIRKNGNSINDFSATNLNTRGGTANNYANKLQWGLAGAGNFMNLDDFYWQSSAAAGAWLGELRCLTRMPLNDQSVQFTRSAASASWTIGYAWSTAAASVGQAYYSPFIATFSGPLASVVFNLTAAITGHIKVAIYDNTGASGGPGAVLMTPVVVTNPVANGNTVTLSGVSVVKGQTYYLALATDTAGTYQIAFIPTPPAFVGSVAYASFPVANPVGLTSAPYELFSSFTVNPTTRNADFVSETPQNALSTYVYDTNPGDQDFYGIAPASNFTAASFSTVAVITRAYMGKSDAGTRNAAVSLKSGAVTVASPTLTLTTGAWQWAWRYDLVDPNTSAAWTAAAVAALQVGPTVVA